ncbi:MAG: phage terminase small subunit P27 family [Candidatus Atribacteria bacterium]|nr:phage terminase small subunit P27 family [Candidatus Atribacteria bacterium]
MGKGRKATPPEVKAFLGNPGKREILYGPKFAKTEDAVAPNWLNARAREEWAAIVPELESTGVLMQVSITALGAYCVAVSNMVKAQESIDRDGIVIETEYGPKRNPATAILAESIRLVQSLACEFGLTPASKGKVGGKRKAKDAFEGWKTGTG